MAGPPKITILSEQLRGKTFELTNDMYTVGRIEERDICIPDPTVSTYHGSFVKSGDTYIFKDNNSTNGTRVNNEPVMEQELKNSDILQMGDVEMLYDCGAKSGAEDKTSNITGISLQVNPTSSAGIKKLDAISPYADRGKDSGRKSQTIISVVIGALILIVAGLMIYVGFTMFGGK